MDLCQRSAAVDGALDAADEGGHFRRDLARRAEQVERDAAAGRIRALRRIVRIGVQGLLERASQHIVPTPLLDSDSP